MQFNALPTGQKIMIIIILSSITACKSNSLLMYFSYHLLGSLVLGQVLNASPCSTVDIYTGLKNWSEHNGVLPF